MALLGAAPSSAAHSDDLSALFEPGTVLSVGVTAGAGPRFQGGNKAGLWGLPYVSFRRPDEPRDWWSPDDGLDVTLLGSRGAQLGAVMDFREGRFLDDDRRLVGLPKIPGTVGVGLVGEVWPVADRFRLRAEITQGARAHDGLLAKLAADLVFPIGRLTFSGGPRLVLADTAATRLEFDVPLATSQVNALLTPYRATPGLRSAGGTLALAYDWSDSWQTIGHVRYDRLLGSAADSPIVRRIGTADALTISAGAIYSFRLAP